jgi:hypothetical protein
MPPYNRPRRVPDGRWLNELIEAQGVPPPEVSDRFLRVPGTLGPLRICRVRGWMCYSRARQLQGALPLPGPAAPERWVGWERGSPPTQAGRWLQPGAAPVTTSELRPGHEMPVREARRLWLDEHLAELRRHPSRRRPARTPPSTSPTRPSRSWTSPKRNAVKSTAPRAWSPPAPCCASDAIANRGGAQTPPPRSSGA